MQPKELPSIIISRLNFFYKVELGEFVAITDRNVEILYVNNRVSQKDVEGFLEVIMFPGEYICDDEEGKGQLLDYINEKYGYHTCRALIDAYIWRTDKEEERRSREAAKEIMPLIIRELDRDNPIVKYNERLMLEIWEAGSKLKRKTEKNLMGYGSICEFYFGYLMGAGILKNDITKI